MDDSTRREEIIQDWHEKLLQATEIEEFKKVLLNFYNSLLSYQPYKSAWKILEKECDSYYKEFNCDCENALNEYLRIQEKHEKLWKNLFEDAKPLENNPYLPEKNYHLIKKEWIPESDYDKRKYYLKFSGIRNLFHLLGTYKPLKIFSGHFLEPDFKVEKFGEGEKVTFTNELILSIEDKINKHHPTFLKSRCGNDFMIFRATIENIDVTDPFGILSYSWKDEYSNDLFALFFLKMVSESEKKNVMVLIKKAVENTFLHIKEIAINEISLDVYSNTRKRKRDGIIKILKANYKEDETDIIIKKLNLELTFKRANQEGKLIRLFVERNTNELSQGVVFAECVQKGGGFTDDDITDSLRNISKKIQRGTNKVFSFSIPKSGTNRMIKFGFSEIIKE